jgi:hypothetical protein
MLIGSNFDHGWGSVVDENSSLILARKLENLLAKVVAEAILHKLDHMVFDLREDEGQVGFVAIFNLLLEIAATVLVLGKLKDLSFKGLKLSVGEAMISCGRC